jgi:hypothetical protein
MNAKIYSEKVCKRLEHIKFHLDGVDNEQKILNLTNNTGNPIASAMGLSSQALASGILAWFERHDLNSMKQWCYVSAKLDQIWYQKEINTTGPGGKMLRLLKPLLSNNTELIDWFSQYDLAFDMKRAESHKTHDFWAYQAMVALRGDWPRLISRCERVLSDPPKSNDQKKYFLDHQFYLALAHGNVERMQSVLSELALPKLVSGRSNDESGFTENLIFTPLVIFAKIAWRHGYKIQIDSPYLPMEWLQIEPLEQYDGYYDFLKIKLPPAKLEVYEIVSNKTPSAAAKAGER